MFIDISYRLKPDMAIYPGNPAFDIKRISDINMGDNATVSELSFGSHTGTHIDAPAHWIKGGKTLDEIPLEYMNGKARVIDVTGQKEISVELIRKYEIKKEKIILFKTDNSLYWDCDRVLDEYVTLTYEAAEYLAYKQVHLVGIDYLSIEKPRSNREKGRSIHQSLLGNGVLICEALNLETVPEGDYNFYCFPLKIKEVDGCPVRCVLET